MINSEEEEEEEEEFYESLDRILSSTSSSTSASDEDSDRHHRPPRFPPLSSAASFDLWISEPSSIEERRRRLLHHFGLAADPSLSRSIVRSRSDGSVDARPKPPPSDATTVHTQRSFHRHRPVPSLGLQPISKPPVCVRPLSSSAIDFDGGDGGVGECTIKNLDTGREFVVKELREDGMWKKLREVGTGRNLSMEEFEMSVGVSPIVQELMRRQNGEEEQSSSCSSSNGSSNGLSRSKKRGGWFTKSIKNVVGVGWNQEKKSSNEKNEDGQEGKRGPTRAKVRHRGKPNKELTGLFMSQEIKAHNGSIWSIKFSLDGKYLASAGEDCVIHVWKVSENEKKGGLGLEGGVKGNHNRSVTAPDVMLDKASIEENHWEKKRRAKVAGGRRAVSSADQLMVPEYVFALSKKPVCSFRGHLDDVLDLSWSKSQHLLSSSMDKTVRLWHLSSNSCLKTFSHSHYVTCIQFNPVDDRYFISGSLDEKVRLWSIPDRQIVDWNDLHEMITAACYTPDGQTALVGSHKGSCHLYNTSGNKLLRESQLDLKTKKKKSCLKKITGFQFAPGRSSEVLITSADSRVRVIDGVELVHKFKGFRNTSSQISACFTANGKYVICASEDSRVYVWRYESKDSRSNRAKGSIAVTQSYEHFRCQDVTVAVPWPFTNIDKIFNGHHPPLCSPYGSNGIVNTHAAYFGDKLSATWPEEKLLISARNYHHQSNGGMVVQSRPAWGMVIVTAGRGGEIRIFQNFGFPI